MLDNLIDRRELPVMLAVFINPGRTPEQPEPTPQEWGDRTTNRPTEYNSLDDKYARVIVDELMPVLHKEYNISKEPERHGIGGASSGAIAAFTVAWERPDHFRKVLSPLSGMIALSVIVMCSGHTFGAALGDVAVADAVLVLEVREAVRGVERMHLERRGVDEEARPDELVVLGDRAGRGRRPGTGSTRCTCGTPARGRRPSCCIRQVPSGASGLRGLNGLIAS